MLALGELQREMGPDMRISAPASILDADAKSEEIDGVAEPHWLASYDSWGNWLNATYEVPGKGSMAIGDTYGPGRKPMFSKWLVSLPGEQAGLIDVVKNPPTGDNATLLVGDGSVADSKNHVRAPLVKLVEKNQTTGRYAWWVGGENQKARVDKGKRPRNLSADQWETSQGDTAEVGVGVLSGLGKLDGDDKVGGKLITTRTARFAEVGAADLNRQFHNLTASSRGVLASVRTGQLKKDLSLLFERSKSALPAPYAFNPGDLREPSIRPMSPEIASKPVLTNRHFASWTRMRHFYRMYRQDSDALAADWDGCGTSGTPALNWAGSKPWTDCNMCMYSSIGWNGEDSYYRFPVLTSLTYILSLRTERTMIASGANKGKYSLYYTASPVCVYWNPYNVEMRVPNSKFAMRSYLAQVHTMDGQLYLGNTPTAEEALRFDDDYARMMSGNGGDVVFKPGEFRIFAPAATTWVYHIDMMPGFNPQAFGGLFDATGKPYSPAENPRFQFRFSNKINGWKHNFRYGNTPASLCFLEYWSPIGTNDGGNYRTAPHVQHVDWFNTSQLYTPVTFPAPKADPWVFDGELLPVGYFQLALKGIHRYDYPTIGWAKDWRCRNWIQAPPFYLGKGLYMSDDIKIGDTQRMDCPFELRFGPLLAVGKDVEDIIKHVGQSALMGEAERVTAVPSLELPTAPVGNLAGFAGMRIEPGWVSPALLNPQWKYGAAPAPNNDSTGNSLYRDEAKTWAYQSGVTGPGVGNSFVHPMIPRTDVYGFLNNSISMEMKNILDPNAGYTATDTKAYCDYWDHVLLLNDALWDDYFVSSLADQTRPGASASSSLAENLRKLAAGEKLANSSYLSHLGGRSAAEVTGKLDAADGYLKAAAHLMVDGMFNVNSTSVDAWHALFAGIRERQVVYRDRTGSVKPVAVPSNKRIALSRFTTETTDQEGIDPEFGVTRDDGMQAWSGVRFLDDGQLRRLAEECVKQVKRRGPFLNFSEFINRRLSNDDLGVMGALQSAIDYDDANPEAGSINYPFKRSGDYMLRAGDLGNHAYSTPEAAVGSRFAGIPGYVIQSDLLKPIANKLSVRDDTFRIRAYGDSVDKNGKILARAWCEAIVQRMPEYSDSGNDPEVPARRMSADGVFSKIDDSDLSEVNRRFGRKFQIESFRWLSSSEI